MTSGPRGPHLRARMMEKVKSMKKADEKKRMCPACMGGMKKVRKDYVFTESGLSNVILKNIDVLQCKKCGAASPRIPRLNQWYGPSPSP
jgi:YgiT-type zinc finger domain-containing protein